MIVHAYTLFEVLLPSALARGFECGIYSQMVRTYVRTYIRVRHALGMSECNA